MAAPRRGPSHQDSVSPAQAEPQGCFASWLVLKGATQEEGWWRFS